MEATLRARPGRGYAFTVAWDPAQYRKFADQRLGPAVDLLNRIDALDEPRRSGFEAAYAGLVAHAYPRRADDRTLLPFRRLFIVAQARQG